VAARVVARAVSRAVTTVLLVRKTEDVAELMEGVLSNAVLESVFAARPIVVFEVERDAPV